MTAAIVRPIITIIITIHKRRRDGKPVRVHLCSPASGRVPREFRRQATSSPSVIAAAIGHRIRKRWGGRRGKVVVVVVEVEVFPCCGSATSKKTLLTS
jgi:hypothetical protein